MVFALEYPYRERVSLGQLITCQLSWPIYGFDFLPYTSLVLEQLYSFKEPILTSFCYFTILFIDIGRRLLSFSETSFGQILYINLT